MTSVEVTPFDGVRYVPAGFEPPTTPTEALRAAAALLSEEGRWRQGQFFSHDNPDHPEFADNPYCNGWGACAIGALQIVTLGAEKHTYPNYMKPFDHDAGSWSYGQRWDVAEDRYLMFVEGCALDEEYAQLAPYEQVYVDAHRLLDHVAMQRGYTSAIHCNDAQDTTRSDVIELFNTAAELDPATTLTSKVTDGT